MKFSTKICLAALAASVAMPAAAQRLGQEKPKDSKPVIDETTTTAATSIASTSTAEHRPC